MQAAWANKHVQASLASSPDEADALIFVESGCRFQTDVMYSPLYKAYAHKSFVLDFLDLPKPVIPGLYACAKRDDAAAGGLLGLPYIRVCDNVLLEREDLISADPEYLFSFVGRVANAPRVRSRILELEHPNALLLDRHSGQSESDEEYVRTLSNSKFILCPRGIGTSSWRIYEAMRVGRVPVIVSDDWLAPSGIDWQTFAIFVREVDIEQIPALLDARESEWESLAHTAKATWQRFFAKENLFAWIAQQCCALAARQRTMHRPLGLLDQLRQVGSIRDAADLAKSHRRRLLSWI